MSGMDMSDMVPTDKERILSLENELESLKRRAKFLEEDVVYWKNRTEVLDKYCKSVRKFYSDDAIERVIEDGYITKDESNVVKGDSVIEDELIVTQDKVENQEESSPVKAVADTEGSTPVVVSTDTEDYKLIAEKVKAENAVLREEIESLREAMRFIQVLSRPDSQSKTPKVTDSIQ